ncbi:MAG: Gfo/Idh/MocA family oxidoreductase [Anaerolineaceae bacterium]|nr:Gfo/Idh/MocA family oxidoreductase [Anaerolineaceae bacterium]
MRTIGVGVIGMGWMGHAHSRAYNQIRDRFHDADFRPRLIVCTDAVESRAREAQERFGFEQYTTDWHAVFQNPEVEVVNITAPNGLHLELNQAAAAAGKHIMCEKPVGRFPSETIASYEAVKDTGLMTGVGYNYRWAPMVQYAKQLLESGELGTLTHYHGRFLNGYAGDPLGFLSWRFEEDQGLGTLGDLMSHVIDMAHLLTGPIHKLVSNRHTFITERPIPTPGVGTHYDVATGNEPRGAVTNEDYVSALVQFENGVQGTLESCRVINGEKCDMSFEIYGTKGALKWNMEQMNELQFQRRNTANPAQDGFTELLSGPAHPYHARFNPAWGTAIGYDDTKVIEAYNFLKSVTTGEQGEPGFKEAYAVARVQEAIMQSWETEKWEQIQA